MSERNSRHAANMLVKHRWLRNNFIFVAAVVVVVVKFVFLVYLKC